MCTPNSVPTQVIVHQNQVLHMVVPVIDLKTGKEVTITVSH